MKLHMQSTELLIKAHLHGPPSLRLGTGSASSGLCSRKTGPTSSESRQACLTALETALPSLAHRGRPGTWHDWSHSPI